MTLQRVEAGGLLFWLPAETSNVAFTSRAGGCSPDPFRSLNLGAHTGDNPANVQRNRLAVSRALGITEGWLCLRQVHGTRVVNASDVEASGSPEADGVADGPGGPPLAVFTADCLPIAVVGPSVRGVIHAGWRGLCAGVIEQGVRGAGRSPRQVSAWIGPSIGPCHFRVGREVLDAFESRYPAAPDFGRLVSGGLTFDLRAAARWILRENGVHVDPEDPPCTFCDVDFFSYRRDGVTGRQAAIVW